MPVPRLWNELVAASGCFEVMTKEKLINSTSAMMGLDRFELRLLHYFDKFCVPAFSYGVNKEAERFWQTLVPKVFFRSRLVRNAVFLFASICMWPLFDMETLFLADVQEMRTLYHINNLFEVEEINSKSLTIFDLSQDHATTNNLYAKTLEYFSDLLLESQRRIEGSEMALSPLRAIELSISGTLIFLFLGLHPHNLVPILAFQLEENTDEDSAGTSVQVPDHHIHETTDFVSICRGIQVIKEHCCLKNSKTSPYKAPKKFSSFPKESKFALISRLNRDLIEYYSNYEGGVQQSGAIDVLKEAIELLESAFHYSTKLNYPLPLYKWPIGIPENFGALLRQRHFFALRIYYLFSCISLMAKFCLYHERNMWRDFIEWFRKYNYKGYGGWVYRYDQSFYDLVIKKKYTILLTDFRSLYDFDAKIMMSRCEEN